MSSTAQVINLISPGTVAITGSAHIPLWNEGRVGIVQACIDGTGTVSATVVIAGSNDAQHWSTIGTLSLSGTTTDTKTQVITSPWYFIRAVSSSLSGTGANVAVNLSI